MKNIKTSLLVVVTMMASIGVYADPGESKVVEKARTAVESANAYDWQVLAKSAEKCFRKNQNIEQALEWIDKSIDIYANPINLEIKGDYYRKNGQPKDAMEYYYKAIIIGKEQNFWFDTNQLQEKIWDLKDDASAFESKGHYHESVGQSEKAMEYYYKAILARKSMNFSVDTSDLQAKIMNLR